VQPPSLWTPLAKKNSKTPYYKSICKQTGPRKPECKEPPYDFNDDDDGDGEQITLAEMMDSATKLENRAPAVGSCGAELLNLCCRFRSEA